VLQRLVLWLLLLYDMVHVTLHTVYIREPSLFGGPRQQQVLALTGPKWPTVIHRIVRYSMVLRRKYQLPKTKLRRLISRRFLLLECPTWLLPVLCDVLESRLTAPQWSVYTPRHTRLDPHGHAHAVGPRPPFCTRTR
jgi:hypothetical protein